MKLGLDMHGVVDKDSVFFSHLADIMLLRDHEVHIVTGREDTEELREELANCSMIVGSRDLFTSILSITTYQKALGVPVCYLNDDPTQPMMDPKVWNPTKATLCATAGIDVMIDDSTLYEPYFRDIKTQYIIFNDAVSTWLSLMFYQDYFTVPRRKLP